MTRGPYAKGQVKRAEIVGVALEHFSEVGYDRASVREVARLCGLSQAALQHYFPTKEHLFVEVLRRRDERNARFYGDDTEREVTISGLERIVTQNASEAGLVRLYVAMSAESTDPQSPARQFFLQRYAQLRSDVAADVRRQQEAGDLPAETDADSLATLLVAAADGLQLQWLLDPDSVDMSARLRDLSASLRRRRAD